MKRKLINLYARAHQQSLHLLSLARHQLHIYKQHSDYRVYKARTSTNIKTTVVELGNAVAVVGVFMGVAVMVNEPLRVELTKSIAFADVELANVQTIKEIDSEPAPSMKRVLMFKGSFDNSEKLRVLTPEILKSPVPSIEPLASQIPGKIDPIALDARLMDSVSNQQKVAHFMANKYRMDPKAIYEYVSHAMIVAKEVDLDPVLLVAVMSIESNFNPNIESNMGAQGLMQVLTRVHADKFAPYGGPSAAFKPEANIRVGAYILKYFIAQTGSLQAGLRSYVGGSTFGDGGYAGKVLREREQLTELLKNPEIQSVPLELTAANWNKVLPAPVKQHQSKNSQTVPEKPFIEFKEQDS